MNFEGSTTLRGDLMGYVEEAKTSNKQLIGESVLPVWAVPTRQYEWPRIEKAGGQLLRNVSSDRQPDGSYNEIKRTYKRETGETYDKGLEERVDDAASADVSRFWNDEQRAVQMVTRNIMINFEIDVAAAIMSATNFTATAAAVTYIEANIATINLVRDVMGIIAAMRGEGEEPNAMVSSGAVFRRCQRSTLLQNFMRGNRPTDALILSPADAIAQAMGLQTWKVSDAVYDSSATGKGFSSSSIWGDTYIWIGNISAGDPFVTGGVGRTFCWSGDGGALFIPESYRDEKRRSNIVRVRHHYACQLLNKAAGRLITTSYA